MFAPFDAVEASARVARLGSARRASWLERRWRELQESASNEMTGLIAADRPLREFIQRGAENWERLFPGTFSVTQFTDETAPLSGLSRGAELPSELRCVLEPLRILAEQFPVAAAHCAPVVFENVEEDPRCASHRDVFGSLGLRACWFLPIASSQQELFGTFAVCSRHVGPPAARELSMGGRAARLLGVALERARIMAALRESETHLRQAQKMEAVGRLAGGVAHDFNNLLTIILNGIAALERTDALANNQVLKQVEAAGERAAALTEQLLAFSRRRAMQPQLRDLRTIVSNVCTLLRRLIGEQIVIETDLGSHEAPAKVDVNMIEQVLMNLVINARDAMPNGGTIRIRLQTAVSEGHLDLDGAQKARSFTRISVSDTGTGIAPEDLPHLFEPFFTTKEPGKGTGLGLALVYSIAEQHGGWVEVQSEPGQGSTFHVFLPSPS
jgi:signal transduction histidine kinase